MHLDAAKERAKTAYTYKKRTVTQYLLTLAVSHDVVGVASSIAQQWEGVA